MTPPPEYTTEETTQAVYTNLLLITFRHLLNCTNLILTIFRNEIYTVQCTDHLITISRNIYCTDHVNNL